MAPVDPWAPVAPVLPCGPGTVKATAMAAIDAITAITLKARLKPPDLSGAAGGGEGGVACGGVIGAPSYEDCMGC